MFARHLESKIRAKAAATARILKNTSELMEDDNIHFFQMLKTISKIAEKGKHTFMIGCTSQIMQNKKT